MKHQRYRKKEGELEKIGKVERKFERKVEKKVMENKNLVIAIAIVFFLVIVLSVVLYLNTKTEAPETTSPTVSSLVTTCDDWCAAENIDGFCDFELSASETVKGTCNGFSKSIIYMEFGVRACPAIDCANRPAEDLTCSGLGGVWEAPVGGVCEQKGLVERFVQEGMTDSPPTTGQICCTEPVLE